MALIALLSLSWVALQELSLEGKIPYPKKYLLSLEPTKHCQANPPLRALGIFQRVNAVEAEDFKSKFPRLFKKLGKPDGPDYVIKLNSDAKPHAISTAKRIPAPLFAKAKEELARMEQMEIISKVDEPTEW